MSVLFITFYTLTLHTIILFIAYLFNDMLSEISFFLMINWLQYWERIINHKVASGQGVNRNHGFIAYSVHTVARGAML